MTWFKLSWGGQPIGDGMRGNSKSTTGWGHDVDRLQRTKQNAQYNPNGNPADPWEDPAGQKTLLKDFNVGLTDSEKDQTHGIVDKLFFNPGEQTREKKGPGVVMRYRDVITPGSIGFRDSSKYGSWAKVSDANGTPYQDVFRAPSPGGQESAPAAAETAVTPPRNVWQHMGDNGIEVYPNPGLDSKLLKDILMGYQGLRFEIPKGPMNVNKIGKHKFAQPAAQSQMAGDIQTSQDERDQQQKIQTPPLILHMVKSHYMDPDEAMQLEQAGELKDIHIEEHATGEIDTHNPEVLRVASVDTVPWPVTVHSQDKDDDMRFRGTVNKGVTGFRGFGSWNEAFEALRTGTWRSRGLWNTSAEGETQFGTKESVQNATRGYGMKGMIETDLSDLPFRQSGHSLIVPNKDGSSSSQSLGWNEDNHHLPKEFHVKATIGNGLGIEGGIPLDNIKKIHELDEDGNITHSWHPSEYEQHLDHLDISSVHEFSPPDVNPQAQTRPGGSGPSKSRLITPHTEPKVFDYLRRVQKFPEEHLRSANILDPITTHLDPEVFDAPTSTNPKLKNTIRNWLIAKVYHLMENNGLPNPEKWVKLVLTGSLTTYQWTADSDFDISVWVDVKELNSFDRSVFVKLVTTHLDGQMVPGTSHPLQCFIVDVDQVHAFHEIYKPDLRSAWDIDRNKWLVKPNKLRVHDIKQEYPDVYHRSLNMLAKMKSLIEYQPEAAEQYWNHIHERRRLDMKAGRGDFADSNVAYKMIANAGLFEDIEKITGEHIASTTDHQYVKESYTHEESGTTYHHLRAFPKGHIYEPRQFKSIEEYEIHKLKPQDKETGFLSWWDDGKMAETEELHVHPDYRHQDIGTGLVTEALKETKHLTSSPHRTEDGHAFLQQTKLLPDPTSPVAQSILRNVPTAAIEPRYAYEISPGIIPDVAEELLQNNTCRKCGDAITWQDNVCDDCKKLEAGYADVARESPEEYNIDLIGGPA